MTLRSFWPVLITLAVGLSMRPLGRVAHCLSDPLGGILYALFLSRLVRFFVPKACPERLAIGVFLVCAVIECGQLSQAPIWVTLRHHWFGNLVLGTGFDPLDLLYYTIGAGSGYLWDRKRQVTASECPLPPSNGGFSDGPLPSDPLLEYGELVVIGTAFGEQAER